MPIKFSPAKSAHEEAAEELHTGQKTTTVKTTKKKAGEPEETVAYEADTEAAAPSKTPYSYLNLNMHFKMPLADYVMVGFDVGVTVPFVADEDDREALFEKEKVWVESKINALVQEQSSGD